MANNKNSKNNNDNNGSGLSDDPATESFRSSGADISATSSNGVIKVNSISESQEKKNQTLTRLSKGKKVISVGLNSVTKAGLTVTDASAEHHVRNLHDPNYEHVKARLVSLVLDRALENVAIPFNGNVQGSVMHAFQSRYPSRQAAQDTMTYIVTQVTKAFHESKEARKLAVKDAVDAFARTEEGIAFFSSALSKAQSDPDYAASLFKDVKMDLTQPKNQAAALKMLARGLEADMTNILTDGLTKSMRDNFGRNVAIPESTNMANTVESIITSTHARFETEESLVDVSMTIELLRSYLTIERRALNATSEFERTELYRALTELRKDITKDYVVSNILKNRIEYSHNSQTPMFSVSLNTFAKGANDSLVEFEDVSVTSPSKILEFEVPDVANMTNQAQTDYISSRSILTYVIDCFGGLSTESMLDDTARMFSLETLEIDKVMTPSDKYDTKGHTALIGSIHKMLFKLRLLRLLADSFTVIPRYNSMSLNKVSQSITGKFEVSDLEPAIIAIDSVKYAYIESLHDTVEVLLDNANTPTSVEIEYIKKMISSTKMFKYAISPEHNSEFESLAAKVLARAETKRNFESRTASIKNSPWFLGYKTVRDTKGLHIVNRDLINSVTSFIEVSSPGIVDDGTMADEEIIALLAGGSGTFQVIPQRRFAYTYGGAELDEYASAVSMDTVQSVLELADDKGVVLPPTKEKVKMYSAEKGPLDAAILEKVFPESEVSAAWIGFLPLSVTLIYKGSFPMAFLTPYAPGRSKKINANSPFARLFRTSVAVTEVSSVVDIFDDKGQLFSVIADVWPSIRMGIQPVADLSTHRYLQTLLDNMSPQRSFGKTYSGQIHPSIRKEDNDKL